MSVFNFEFCIFSHLINYAWLKSKENKQNLKIGSCHCIAKLLESWVANFCLKSSFHSSDVFGGGSKSTFWEKSSWKFWWGTTPSKVLQIAEKLKIEVILIEQHQGHNPVSFTFRKKSQSPRPLTKNARDKRYDVRLSSRSYLDSIPLWSRSCGLSGIKLLSN